jgi:hypothetical protein
VTPGARIAAALPNVVIYEDGVPQQVSPAPSGEAPPWSAAASPA